MQRLRTSAIASSMRLVLGFIALSTGLFACTQTPKDPLRAPRVLVAPYDAANGESLWAVVPLRNEAGTTLLDASVVSDKLVSALDQVQGIRAVPLNRTIQTMRALNMGAPRSPQDLRALAAALGVDAVVVGSVTAWDPYTPLIGMSLAVYGAENIQSPGSGMDARALSTRTRDSAGGSAAGGAGRDEDPNRPLASVAETLDGKNNQVQMDVRSFAEGRVDGPSALGWRRYLASSELFTEFAAYRMADLMVQSEWARLGQVPPNAKQPVDPDADIGSVSK